MKHIFLSALLLGASIMSAQAQDVPPPVPDEAPPLVVLDDESSVPQVTIVKRGGNTIEEHRLNGRLFKVVVTPEIGPPYTLVDRRGDGHFVPMPATQGSPQMSVPMWVIGTF